MDATNKNTLVSPYPRPKERGFGLVDWIKKHSLPVEYSDGITTKFNRVQQNYPKKHWIDASCVGEFGCNIKLDILSKPLQIQATGHGNRQMCQVNKYGFPKSKPRTKSVAFGFHTGDISLAKNSKGVFIGRTVIRTSGHFIIQPIDKSKAREMSYKKFSKLQFADGYSY